MSPLSPETVAQISQTSQLPSYFDRTTGAAAEAEAAEAAIISSASYQCCRCDNTQTLAPDEAAVCEKCTKAVCRKCKLLDSDHVVPIDKSNKAQLPPNRGPGQCWWFCHNCGARREVAASKLRRDKIGSVTVDLKNLACRPCNQKACGACLAIVVLERSEWTAASPPSTAARSAPRQPILRSFASGLNLRNRSSGPARHGDPTQPLLQADSSRLPGHLRSQPSIQTEETFGTRFTRPASEGQMERAAVASPERSQSSRGRLTRLLSTKLLRRWTSAR
jgi:hypothetical protein